MLRFTLAYGGLFCGILSAINRIQYNPRVSELNTLERIRQAARDGDPFAQFELGYSYECGAWVEQDFKKAAEFYAKAANQGHGAAEQNLLLQHISGRAKLHRPSVVFSKLKSLAEAGIAMRKTI